ncbi:hypothetical protein [Variovorax sp. Root434]|uniref:hypothetical protein n=1 Tax=Variovorax sp. Root434 TaxID=1736536 RepID=UPI000AF5A589|nr:hypothetical protein [Variovorax sp. Root434]
MTSIKNFLDTAELGPVMLGSATFELMDLLGDPDRISQKSNPLLVHYGDLELIFWKSKGAKKQVLREFTLFVTGNSPRLPDPVQFSDWPSSMTPTMAWLGHLSNMPPSRLADQGGKSAQFMFPSGVIASTHGGTLKALSVKEKETRSQPSITIPAKDEISNEAFREIEEETLRVAQAGYYRSALLIGWSVMEALLRQLARKADQEDSMNSQPHLLLKLLKSSNALPLADYAALERLRQIRAQIAHGMAAHVTQEDIQILLASIEEAKTALKNRTRIHP